MGHGHGSQLAGDTGPPHQDGRCTLPERTLFDLEAPFTPDLPYPHGQGGICAVNTGLFLLGVRFDNRPPLTGFPICWTNIPVEKMSFSDIREKIVRIFVDNSDRFF